MDSLKIFAPSSLSSWEGGEPNFQVMLSFPITKTHSQMCGCVHVNILKIAHD